MNNNFLKEIEPGSIIGILGGGQLGRMTVEAASKLGYQCHVFCQSEEEPAAAGLFSYADSNKEILVNIGNDTDAPSGTVYSVCQPDGSKFHLDNYIYLIH